MEVHQTEFLHAVVLAGAVALGMTVWENSREEAHLHPSGTQSTGVRQSHIAVAARRIEVQP